MSFSYTGERHDLDSIEFEIKAGTSVALVGPSGSGKSTVLGVLMRQYSPRSGVVRIDDCEMVASLDESLLEQTAVVPQESLLLNISVRENIRLGRRGASNAEVEQAARVAEVHDVIVRMPRGYDTVVGERGGNLSGGQRQRIAIARAVLREPALLLLDEATSALDAATEAAITKTLVEVRRGRTVVSVTHRLDSVADYDCLLVLDGGRLVEQGTHAELLALGGVYGGLWAQQHSVSVSADGVRAHVEPQFLARVPLFSELQIAELEHIVRHLATMHFSEDQVLFRAGDPADAFYIVARGIVDVDVPQDVRSRTRALTEGEFFGEIALIDDRPRTATVRTRGPTTLLVLTRPSFEKLLGERTEIREALEQVARKHLARDLR